MESAPGDDYETKSYRLILPRDANHHGTLYAGVLLTVALEEAYATAFRASGLNANLVLKRVLDLRCREPVRIGQVIEIRGREVHRARAQSVVGLYGSPLSPDRNTPWLDALMQFVQVDETGRPMPLVGSSEGSFEGMGEPWDGLRARGLKLLSVRF